MTETVYLSLGTNLGDRSANLAAALAAIQEFARLEAISPVYQTAPWGYTEQPAFLNQVVKISTELAAAELLGRIKACEVELGRQPNFRYGPRLIDIDILVYGQLVLDSPSLVIPHPRLAERAFVLVPLADLAPDLSVPGLGRTVRDLLASLDRADVQPWPAGTVE
jgi:2-amino-4-hydroxy-6-hydroxymethyldihydropteridine diphosphokinase